MLKKDASELRTELGYGISDSINLKNVLVKLDVIAVFKPLSDSFSGMAIKTNFKDFILINSNHSMGRQNFSICHELFHLYKDPDFTPHHSTAGNFIKSNSEYRADIFASYFLLPEDGVLSLIPNNQLKKDSIGIETILKIEHYFGCSRSALLYRLKELTIITSKLYDTFCQSIISTARRNGYLTDLYEAGNSGLVLGDYGSLARSLLDYGKISEGHYIALMQDIGIDIFNSEGNGDQP